MSERTSYAPGTFSWVELATSDAGAAKEFYASVFGWTYEDHQMPDGGVYSMVARDGRHVAGLFGAGDEPPHWNCYVTVESADATAAGAAEHGGSVITEPFDVMDAGRMAVIGDPTGAALCVWEPRGHIGAALVNAPGAFTWTDLVTPDPEEAARFYTALLDWTIEPIPASGGYRIIRNAERSNGGILPLDPDRMGADVPPAWMPYFGHEDVHRLLGEADGRGARVLAGPMQLPQGTIAVLADPQGAVFGAWTGEYDD